MPHDIDEIAEEVKRYLNDHAGAADTVEGIARWWLVRSRVDALLPRVQQALDLLVKQDVLTRQHMPGGSYVYSGAHRQASAVPLNGAKQ